MEFYAKWGNEMDMKIVICEDNAVQCEEIRKLLGRVFFSEEDVEIRCFSDGDELVKAAYEETEFHTDMIFLDINMPRLDGIQTAKLIRKKYDDIAIVFLTASSEHVFMGYEVHAYDYILKPPTEEKLRRVVERFLEEQKEDSKKYIFVKRNGKRIKIMLEWVLYFMSDKRKIFAFMEEPFEYVEFYMTMRELEAKVGGKGFLRCHQSYLVNMNKLTNGSKTSVNISESIQIPVSKRYREDVEKTLNRQTRK